MNLYISMKRTVRVLLSDMNRAFCSLRFSISIVLIFVILVIASFEDIYFETDVLYVFSIVMYGMPALAIMIASAFVYADSICKDIEHRNLLNVVLRSGVRDYVLSKVFTIFVTAAVSVCIGIIIYVIVLRCFLPWGRLETELYQNFVEDSGFSFLLNNELHILYYALWGIQYGMLAGVLAVCSAYVSLFITNRMLVLATPFICFYFIDYILIMLFQGEVLLESIYRPSKLYFKSDLQVFLLALVVSVIAMMLLVYLIKRKIISEYLS